jgi:hypothetical protein
MSIKDDILLAGQGLFRIEPIASPELQAVLNEQVYCRELTAAESGEYAASRVDISYDDDDRIVRKLNFRNLKARLLVRSLVRSDGVTPVFGPEDCEALGKLPDHIIDPLFDQAQRLTGLDARAQRELEKNLSGRTSLSPSS